MTPLDAAGAGRYRRLVRPLSFSGTGLHSGLECSLRILPAEGGIVLASEGQEAPIEAMALSGSGRGSDYLFPDGSRIRTCEHVLAALTGLGVWGARLEVDGGEMPALDGCAARVGAAVMENSEPCGEAPAPLSLSASLRVGDESRFVVAFPAEGLHVTCVVRYDAPVIGVQMLEFSWSAEGFLERVARARTFAMAREIEALRAQGLALGGTLDNAILVEGASARASGGLHWPDEFVRHKALDLIGDLAALGRPLCAHLVAVKAGHELHLQMTERLRALVKRQA